MIEVKGFNGKLNVDDNPYRLPKGDYIDSLNITRDAQGDGQDLVVSNVVGNKSALYFRAISDLQPNNPNPTTNSLFLTFYGCPFPNTLIEIYLYDHLLGNVLVSSYTTQAYDTIPTIVNNLFLNFTSCPGVTVSVPYQDTFLIFYNNTTYTDFVYTILPINPNLVNKTIGTYADKIRNRQYFFVWNSAGYDKICYYDGTTNEVVLVLEDRTYTDNVRILNFDPSYRINHIDIVYRDNEGDLLFWTDGLNPPSKINVKTAIDGGYGVVLRSYIDVAKEPPSSPPSCVYDDDPNVTINNLNNKQFKFKYRYVYDDLEKSVTSAQSEVPIPKLYSSQAIFSNPTINSNIFISFDTGEKNVTKIELLGAQSLGNTWSDFFLISVIDKTELNIPDNMLWGFRFYNNEAYNTIAIDESIQPFDAVPQKAYTQSLPNGNVLDYGAITEGYDLITPSYYTNNEENFIDTSTTYQTVMVLSKLIYDTQLSSPGELSVQVVVEGVPTVGETINVYVLVNGVQTLIDTTVTVPTAYSVKLGLQATAISLGLACMFNPQGDLIILKIGGTIDVSIPPSITPTTTYIPNYNSFPAYDWSSRYSYGVVYFDEKGRTNSVITSLPSSFQTQGYYENSSYANSPYIPSEIFSINSAPPDWATYFEIVRTKNLTKSNFLYWISERTFVDATTDTLGYKYAYISISTLTQYIIDNPEVKSLGYEFTPGDRIRFVKLYNSDTTTSQIYTDKDYEIINSLTNPIINGIQYTGQILKIVLPSTSSTFGFGTDQFANYLIEIYTPANNYSNNLNLYYEFGEKYSIGNPGTPNAYHKGQLQNQVISTSTPALFMFYKGDSYFRYRLYPATGKMRWAMTPGVIVYNGIAGGNLTVNTSNNPNYTPNQNPTAWWYGNPAGNPTSYLITINNTSRTYAFFIKGSIKIKSSINIANPILSFISAGAGPLGVLDIPIGPLTANVEKTTEYAGVLNTLVGHFQVSAVVSAGYGASYSTQIEILDWNISISENKNINQGIIDPNFSDTYESSASQNGRAWKIDPNAQKSFNPTLIRFGGEYQAGTTVNDINRFYENDFDVYDRSRGSIKKMFIEGRNQYIFQEFDVGVVTVLTQIVRDTAGNPLSAQSDKLLNKIVYPYVGQYGIGNVPESFAYGKRAKYFVDNNKGVVCRLSTDGITPLSITYKMNAFFVAKLAPFKENLNTTIPATGTPTVYGAFDAYTNKYILSLSEIDRDDFYQEPYTLSFLESRDSTEGFESFLSFHPDYMGALNNLLITFKNSGVWTHNNSIFCNFYNDQYGCSIKTAFNDQAIVKKTYLAIMQTASSAWACPLIESQAKSYGNTPQQTSLSEARFVPLEDQYSSAILRDANSPGGIINGDTMKGSYLIVKFEKNSAPSFQFLNTASLKYVESPLNAR